MSQDSKGEKSSSYVDILKSSSIIGGSQGFSYLITLVQVKLVALFIGPAGTGLMGFYNATLVLVQNLAVMGLNQSAVREMARLTETGEERAFGRLSMALLQLLLGCSALGWLICLLFAGQISEWTFGSVEHATAIRILGSSLVFSTLSSGFSAIFQGSRRITILGKLGMVVGPINAVVAIILFALLRERGILPVVIASAGVNFAISWYFLRQLAFKFSFVSWGEMSDAFRKLIWLGLVFTWAGLLGAFLNFALRSIIVRDFGLEANGYYQAAWTISGLFAGFVIGAMSIDFYPRLTQVANDDQAVNRMVNEQTEIGILCTLPGLIGSMTFAPLIIELVFSSRFEGAFSLLPWFVVGVFGRVVSWPAGYILLAKNARTPFALMEGGSTLFHLGCAWALMKVYGLLGVAIAFPVLYLVLTTVLLRILKRYGGFRWSADVKRLLAVSFVVILVVFSTVHFFPGMPAYIVGGALTVVSGYLSIAGIVKRLGPDNTLVRRLLRLPGARLLFRHLFA